jgi:serine/threonine-protein kinase
MMSGVTAAAALAGIVAVWLITSRLEAPELDRALDRSHEVADGALRRRLGNLELVVSLLGHDAPFRAYVTEGDPASILDNLQERLALSNCDAFLVTDRVGALLADTRRPGGGTADVAASELVTPSRGGRTVSGLWLDPDGRLYLAASSPIIQGGTDVAGVIVALDAIDNALATELRGAAGAEVVVYAEGAQTPQGTSIVGARDDFDRMAALTSPRVAIGGEGFAARSYALRGIGPKPVGHVVVLRSLARELSALRRIETALLWVGATAVILSIAASVILARRITRPMADLINATERIAAGDLEAVVPDAKDDEMGSLADAFRAMVRELKEKADMEAYLASVVRGATTPSASLAGADSESTVTQGTEVLAGRFELGPVLGSGGMGTVYLAFDRALGERVAVKVLNADTRDAARSALFVQEVRLARRITHRNVVRTHDVVALDAGWALSMEYVEGLSLATLMRRGPLPFVAALGIARQVASGLEGAHAQSIVHRDLKPGNVLLDNRGIAKISDFGLAQILGAGAGPTAHGPIVGTPLYMSPEQADGRDADARSDVYSAGIMFFQLFCGFPPFDAATLRELLEKHRRQAPPRPRSLRPDLPEEIERTILRALEKDPAGRFASGRELREALRSEEG